MLSPGEGDLDVGGTGSDLPEVERNHVGPFLESVVERRAVDKKTQKVTISVLEDRMDDDVTKGHS